MFSYTHQEGFVNFFDHDFLQLYFMKLIATTVTESLLLSIAGDTQMSKTVSSHRKLTM